MAPIANGSEQCAEIQTSVIHLVKEKIEKCKMRILDFEKNSQLTGIHSNKISMWFPITVPKRTILSAVIKQDGIDFSNLSLGTHF